MGRAGAGPGDVRQVEVTLHELSAQRWVLEITSGLEHLSAALGAEVYGRHWTPTEEELHEHRRGTSSVLQRVGSRFRLDRAVAQAAEAGWALEWRVVDPSGAEIYAQS